MADRSENQRRLNAEASASTSKTAHAEQSILGDITNVGDTQAGASSQSSQSQKQAETDMPSSQASAAPPQNRVLPNFAVRPPMEYLNQGSLADIYQQIEPDLDRILNEHQPRFQKAIPGLYTMGGYSQLEASYDHPAVIMIKIHGEDTDRVHEVEGSALFLVDTHFGDLAPPIRYYIFKVEPL